MFREGQWTSRLFRISFLALIGSGLFLASCSQKERVMEEPNFEPTPGKTYQAPAAATESESIELDHAYFDYDKAILKPHAKALLRKNAAWLKKHPEAEVQVEGNCDERGTFEYNLALGEKRALAAKRFLISQGIEPARISTLSRGSVPGSQPNKMARNRKAAFMVYYRE